MILSAIAVDTFGDSYIVTVSTDERGNITVKQCRDELLTDDLSDLWIVWSHDTGALVTDEETAVVADAIGHAVRIVRFMR